MCSWSVSFVVVGSFIFPRDGTHQLRNRFFFSVGTKTCSFVPLENSAAGFFSRGVGPWKQIQGADGMFFGFHMMLGFNKVRGCRCPKIGLKVAERCNFRGSLSFLICCAFCVHCLRDYHCLNQQGLVFQIGAFCVACVCCCVSRV